MLIYIAIIVSVFVIFQLEQRYHFDLKFRELEREIFMRENENLEKLDARLRTIEESLRVIYTQIGRMK